MAVWLTMNMSYVGPGDYQNTSKVSVSVNVHWSHVSYNRDGGSLVVTVDGVSDSRVVPFNAGETSSGMQTIYNSYWNVSQANGAAKTVYASATFQATNQTTATPASASLSLAAISGSGGGNTGGNEGGGSEGGNTGGDSGGNDDTYYQIIFNGPGAEIFVTLTDGSGSYPRYKEGSAISISVYPKSGYKITSCTIDGVSTTSTSLRVRGDIRVNVTTTTDTGGSGGGTSGGGGSEYSYLEFTTTNKIGYSFETRIKYTISGGTIYIDDVQFKSNDLELDSPFYLDGVIKIDGVTVYTCSSDKADHPILLDSSGEWISSDISCSKTFSGNTISVQLAPNKWSTFFGIYGTNESFNFQISSTAKSITVNSGESGGSGGDEQTAKNLWVFKGYGTDVTIQRFYDDTDTYSAVSLELDRQDDSGEWYRIELQDEDYFKIEASAATGYIIDTYNYVGSNGNTYTFNFNVTGMVYDVDFEDWGFNSSDGVDAYVYVTATKEGSGSDDPNLDIDFSGYFFIDDGQVFYMYECYIDNGVNWEPFFTNQTVTTKTGSVRASVGSDSLVSVNCGFKPDIVIFYTGDGGEYDNVNSQYFTITSLPFTALNKSNLCSSLWVNSSEMYLRVYVSQNENGFAYRFINDDGYTFYSTFSYVALKRSE